MNDNIRDLLNEARNLVDDAQGNVDEIDNIADNAEDSLKQAFRKLDAIEEALDDAGSEGTCVALVLRQPGKFELYGPFKDRADATARYPRNDQPTPITLVELIPPAG